MESNILASIIISIGNIPVKFELRSEEMASRILKRYKGFIGKKNRPVLILNCSFSSRFSSEGEEVTINHKENKEWHISRSDFNCVFSGNRGNISMRRSIYSFDACLRVLFSILLTINNGLLLHCAGIVKDKKGNLFLGPSGSGKTTIARLSLNTGTVLNDEIIACKLFKNNITKIYGTPFWGEMRKGPAYNKSFPLNTVYFLNKSNKTFKTSISHKVALNKLLKCCCTFSRDISDMEKVITTTISLINSSESYNLYFEKRPTFWNIV